MARVELRGVLVESGLCFGVLLEKLCQCFEVLKGVLVSQMARLQAVEQGWQASQDSCGQQCLTVCGEKVDKG